MHKTTNKCIQKSYKSFLKLIISLKGTPRAKREAESKEDEYFSDYQFGPKQIEVKNWKLCGGRLPKFFLVTFLITNSYNFALFAQAAGI